MANGKNTDTFAFRLLTGRSARPVRHLALITAVVAISVSQNVSHYAPYAGQIGNGVYMLSAVSAAAYLLVAYLHVYRLVPRFLLCKRYARFFFFSILSVSVLTLVRIGEDAIAVNLWNLSLIHKYNYAAVLNFLSDFATDMLCITGISVTVLLRHLVDEQGRIHELEQSRLAHEIEAVKASADPGMLLSTIHLSAVKAGEEPEESAGLILGLSGILRYQLYESRKEKVFLQSEIKFIREYLDLHIRRNPGFSYTLKTEGSLFTGFVPPLAFMPFISAAIKSGDCVEIGFEEKNGYLRFLCTGIGSPLPEGLEPALSRLRNIYGPRFGYQARLDGLFVIDIHNE